MDRIIQKAKEWAEQAWKEAVSSWLEQPGQDRAYREYLVRPCIAELLKQLGPLNSVIDIGCGDGAETIFVRKCLDKLGMVDTKILGVDLLGENIFKARESSKDFSNLFFEVGDITNVKTIEIMGRVIPAPDLVFSSFVLQDIPDLESLLTVVTKMLRPGGKFLSVSVHPNFAQALKNAGYLMRTNYPELDSEYLDLNGMVQWRYAGYYPIVREKEDPFYVPYFHREKNDYCKSIRMHDYDIEQIIELMPSLNNLKSLHKVSPFYNHIGNVYWPHISEINSSLVIIAVKQ